MGQGTDTNRLIFSRKPVKGRGTKTTLIDEKPGMLQFDGSR